MIALVFAALVGLTSAQTPIDIGSRRELFLDRLLIDSLKNARAVLHHPVEKGAVLRLDKPWEGAFSAYFTVLHAEGKYRLYYRGNPIAGRDGSPNEVTCYAESEDGIAWRKPNLRIHTVGGSLDNNTILAQMAPLSHNFAPFYDSRPGVPQAERFKAVAGIGSSGLVAFASGDGVHWRKMREEPILPKGTSRYDSQNLAFWSESEGRYILYFRTFKPIGGQRYRWISRTTSSDFLNWSEPQEMSFGDAPPEHLYTNQTSPYFRAPHLYISIAARFFPGRQVLDEEEARRVNVNPGYFKDVSDAVLFTTRGDTQYDRTFLEAFVRPGLGLENWTSRTNYPAWNVVQTGPGEMSLYVNRNYGQPTSYLARYAMRLDGFASVQAGAQGGELLTKPFKTTGGELELNFSTSAGGGIRVEVQDESGKPLPGYALSDSRELIGDSVARTITKVQPNGRPIRLRFVLQDADLFSFRFVQ
jgi:hypothetical protein